MKADILIEYGDLVSVTTREVLKGWQVAIVGGRITYVGPKFNGSAKEVIDARRQFLVPGLCSGHDHFEMTLMDPVAFAEAVIPAGTTAAIIDPHDIVNVMGMEGMRLLIETSQSTPLKCFFMIPPCVPSSPELEDAGYEVRLEDVQKGMQFPKVLGIAEAMDFLRVTKQELEMTRILDWARSKNLPVDGHCPGARGTDLCRYIAAGPIRTDHESITTAEQLEKLRLGMKVIMRRGSIQEPMSAGELVNQLNDTSNLLLSVDGCISVEDILKHGHMSWAVRQLINEGVDPLIAIQMATINVAGAYGFDHQIGLIAPGRIADILFVNDLQEFRVEKVMVNGKIIQPPLTFPRYSYPEYALNTIQLDPVSTEDFVIQALIRSGRVTVRVIGVHDGGLVTEELLEEVEVKNGIVKTEPERDLLKVAVFERYGGGTRTVDFIRGFDLRSGAIAGSIGQDSQNVVVVGVNDADMALAVNRVIELNGGIVVATQGNITAELSLPIGGIITDINPRELAAKRTEITTALRELGCQLTDPIFTLSLSITLIVIPHLKISNRGLVDVNKGGFVNLFV